MQHPPPPVFVPGEAAVTPPGGQNRPPLGRAVKAKVVNGSQTVTTVNPFTKATKGTESGTILNSNSTLEVNHDVHKIDRDTLQRG